MIREAVHEPAKTIRRCGSGRVSAHEILLRTSERTEGAEAEKEKLPTAQTRWSARLTQESASQMDLPHLRQ